MQQNEEGMTILFWGMSEQERSGPAQERTVVTWTEIFCALDLSIPGPRRPAASFELPPVLGARWMVVSPGFPHEPLSDFKSLGEQMLPQASGFSFVQTLPRCVPMLDLMPSTTWLTCPECPPHPSALIQTLHLSPSHLLVLLLTTPAPGSTCCIWV